MALSARFAALSRPKRWALALLCLAAAFYGALRLTPLPDEALLNDYSAQFTAQDGTLLRLTLNQAGRYRLKLDLEELSPYVRQGFLAYEDRRFYWHPGVDPVAVLRALRSNSSSGRVVSGASTLTMQLARMMQRRPRSLGAKLAEAWRALALEARYSKRELLELYLNSVPMGGNVEGVGAAAWLYFGKPAKLLSASEAALLISLPKSPNSRRPDRDVQKAKAAAREVLRRIGPKLRLGAEELASFEAYEPPPKRQANPQLAPHLWGRATQASQARGAGYRLSLEPGLQKLVEAELAKALQRLKPLGVANAAAILVANQGRRVLAYVGSPDLKEPQGGQVNMADQPRSPGSTLKPFIYGLALDAGLATPKRCLYDIPRDYGGYKPVNMETRYQGPVPAQDALVRSLNIPAVGLESALQGQGGLLSLLKEAGIRGRGRDNLEPGLSVALGAYPLTLEELVTLYAALATDQVLQPLCFNLLAPPPAKGRPLLSEGAAFLVAQMLAQGQRPDLPSIWEADPKLGRVAFKTGTSFGNRDAWCLAYDPDYTLGVWLGNASAKGAVVLTGAKTASPVAFGIFSRLNRHRDRWFKAPESVANRKVCLLTGENAGANCPHSTDDYYLPGASDNQACRVHQRLTLHKKGRYEVCPRCLTGKDADYETKVFEIWPLDITRFLRLRDGKLPKLPPHNPACPYFSERPAPRMLSPNHGGHYELNDALDPQYQRIALSAQAGPDARWLTWFVDGSLTAEGPPEQIHFWRPRPGRHKVSVIDSEGRAALAELKVEWKQERVKKERVVELGR